MVPRLCALLYFIFKTVITYVICIENRFACGLPYFNIHVISHAPLQHSHMPRVNQNSKRGSGADGRQFFCQFVNGVLVHGHRFFMYIGHDSYGIRAFADLQIECLLRTIVAMDKEYATKGKTKPRTLFIQLDSAKDNKNKYVMAFMEYLVNCKVFDKIEVAFLLVGHTHEDIDQRFSVLSRHLDVHDALTPSEWRTCVHDAYIERKNVRPNEPQEGTPVIKSIFSMHAFSVTLKPWIDVKYAGHSVPHLFQFYMCPTLGICVQRYKHYSTSAGWFPHGRTGELGADQAPAPCLVSGHPFSRGFVFPLRMLSLLRKKKINAISNCVNGYIVGKYMMF
jgi:hypothetical protein